MTSGFGWWCGLVGCAAILSASEPGGIHREVFLPSPGPGIAVLAASYYTRAAGIDLISMHQLMSRSDTTDVAFFRHSSDNGATWSGAQEVRTHENRPDGKLRRMLRGGYFDPRTDRFIRFRIEGLLPTDHPLDGMKQWAIFYSVSDDGGRTWCVDEQVIHDGEEYSSTHPLPGVWRGKNCYMVGDTASVPITLEDGTILVPIAITPVGPDGEYHNPGGGYTYFDAAVLRGRWAKDRRHLQWEVSQRVEADPSRSTRGMDEPTLAQLPGGTILMVLRGSNDKKPELPSRRWYSVSRDAGRTWDPPKPWTYVDGENFYSPASCSQLVTHSSGRIFWLGNISSDNPVGNRPRYPFVIGEVDPATGLLRRDSVRAVDDRGEGDSALLSLSNFYAREDRVTGNIVLHMSRLFQRSTGPEPDWTSDAYVYRILVK